MATASRDERMEENVLVTSNWVVGSGALPRVFSILKEGKDGSASSSSTPSPFSFQHSVVLVKEECHDSCQITFCIHGSNFVLNRVRILSTAKTCEFYAQKRNDNEADYVCTTKGKRFLEIHDSTLSPLSLPSTNSLSSMNRTSESELSQTLEFRSSSGNSNSKEKRTDLYYADSDFPLSAPCYSVSIKFLSLVQKERVEVVSVFITLVQTRLQDSLRFFDHASSNETEANDPVIPWKNSDIINSKPLNSSMHDLRLTSSDNNTPNMMLPGLLSTVLPLLTAPASHGAKGDPQSLLKAFANLQTSKFPSFPPSQPNSKSIHGHPPNAAAAKDMNATDLSTTSVSRFVLDTKLGSPTPDVSPTSPSTHPLLEGICDRLHQIEECCKRLEFTFASKLDALDKRVSRIEESTMFHHN